jgi:phytanoyl-CoA hydroxylase
VQPGGHCGPLRERFVRDGGRLAMERLDDSPWPTTAEALPVEVAAGSLVCLHGF